MASPENAQTVAPHPAASTTHNFRLDAEELTAARRALRRQIRHDEQSLETLKRRVGAAYRPGGIEDRIARLRSLYFKFHGSLEQLESKTL